MKAFVKWWFLYRTNDQDIFAELGRRGYNFLWSRGDTDSGEVHIAWDDEKSMRFMAGLALARRGYSGVLVKKDGDILIDVDGSKKSARIHSFREKAAETISGGDK